MQPPALGRGGVEHLLEERERQGVEPQPQAALDGALAPVGKVRFLGDGLGPGELCVVEREKISRCVSLTTVCPLNNSTPKLHLRGVHISVLHILETPLSGITAQLVKKAAFASR